VSAEKTTAQPTPPIDDKTVTPPTQKKRSTIEKAITWNLIALLLLAVLNELRAQTGYKNALAAIEAELVDKTPTEMPTLKSARALMTLWPVEIRGHADDREVVFFRWLSPFKLYEIVCGVESIEDPDPVLRAVGTREPSDDGQPAYIAWSAVKEP
jgi:hypothetical protein